jgi:DNA-binding NtrC family response regulator
MKGTLPVLIIDDDPIQLKMFQFFFDKLHYPPCDVYYTSTFDEFKRLLRERYIGLVITDYYMPECTGLDVLRYTQEFKPSATVVVSTVMRELEKALVLMREGAYDLLFKPWEDKKLELIVRDIYEKLSLFNEEEALKAVSHTPEGAQSSSIIYKSRAMEKVMNLVTRSADSDSNVIIVGESGTGKELVAHAIYHMSSRKDRPFVTLNVAALPETLIESELFGHKKGAFTGAVQDRIGRFQEAHEGTLFIDEVGDISLAVQVKLLRAIQFKHFHRVGDNQVLTSDARIITATNRNLNAMIADKEFREDLYFRLNVVTITLPPLRSRRQDIMPLVDHFIQIHSARMKKECSGVSTEAENLLMNYHFPGNVRELENIIEHALVFLRGPVISTEELPDSLKQSSNHRNGGDCYLDGDFELQMKTHEMNLINYALEHEKGNKSAAARLMGITERKLRSRMNILGIDV